MEEEYIIETNRLDPQIMETELKRCFPESERLLMEQDELYYYTDINAFVNGILRNREDICLWASRWSHLNDPEELNTGINELKSIFPKELNWMIDGIKERMKKNHSISFSVYRDYLPMWKMYGDNGRGLMLTFDTKELVKLWGGLLQPCLYKGSKEHIVSKESILNTKVYPYLSGLTTQQQYAMIWLLQIFVSITKNQEYDYEKEVRLIGVGNNYLGNNEMQRFRVSNNQIIPYVEVFIPNVALKNVCLGPLVKSELNEETLKEFLRFKGYDTVEVSTSNIHYR